LMAALEAGADNGEGDSRCTGDGIPSDSAYLQVDLPDAPAGSFLSLRIPTSGNDSPLPLVRAEFDAWRLTSPCPALRADAGASDASTESDAATSAPTPPEPAPSGAGGSPPLDATPEPPSAGAPAAPASAAPPRSRRGCSVAGAHTTMPGALGAISCGIAALLVGVLGRARGFAGAGRRC
jgi:hypothetical protein